MFASQKQARTVPPVHNKRGTFHWIRYIARTFLRVLGRLHSYYDVGGGEGCLDMGG